jgi:hypothetical protein
MSTTSNRSITVSNAGDFPLPPVTLPAAANPNAAGEVQVIALALGNNTITPPVGTKGVSIQKPAGNAVALTLKGIAGDTGFPLDVLDPDSFSVSGSFVINAGAAVSLRFYWS